MQRQGQVSAIAVENRLAAVHERDLQNFPTLSSFSRACTGRKATNLELEVLQDLDERWLEAGNFEPVLDAPNEADRIHIDADVFKQPANEPCEAACQRLVPL